MLEEQIKKVAQLRKEHATLKQAKWDSYVAYQEANKELLEAFTNLESQVIEAEKELRELTLDAYNETGNNKPANGVGIRETTKLKYNEKEAYQWALQHVMALQLDKKAFEKIAQVETMDFVQVEKVPQATIATDLSGYLEENNDK